LIRLRNVRKTYRGPGSDSLAVSDVTLDIAEAALVSVVDPSGCGKTTLLKIRLLVQTARDVRKFLTVNIRSPMPIRSRSIVVGGRIRSIHHNRNHRSTTAPSARPAAGQPQPYPRPRQPAPRQTPARQAPLFQAAPRQAPPRHAPPCANATKAPSTEPSETPSSMETSEASSGHRVCRRQTPADKSDGSSHNGYFTQHELLLCKQK